MSDTHQDHLTCSWLDVNDADHDSNVTTYSEYTWEISSSRFPHFECVIIDSCDYMLIPQIPANLTQQGIKKPLSNFPLHSQVHCDL